MPGRRKKSAIGRKRKQHRSKVAVCNENVNQEKEEKGASSSPVKPVSKRKQLTPKKVKQQQPTPKNVDVKLLSDIISIASQENTPETSAEKENVEETPVEETKKTRGKRKRKQPHILSSEYVLDDDDIDLDLDSSTEYKPPKEFEEDPDEFEEDEICKKKRSTKGKTTKIKEEPKKKRQKKTEPKKNQETLQDSETDGSVVKTVTKRKYVRKKALAMADTSSLRDIPDLSEGDDKVVIKPKRGRKKKIKPKIVKKRMLMDREIEYVEGEETEKGKSCKSKKDSKYGQPYSVTGSWYIASGYLQDLTHLLQCFEEIQSWRYKDFAMCWQKKKFSLIYRGRQNFKELLEFSEEVALLTKRFLLPPHSLKLRIGALYTIYGLYYKHPFRHFFKIRLIRSEYQELVDLVEKFRTSVDNPDPAYIFRKMEIEGAYHHVATSSEMGLDFYSSERDVVDVKYESQRLANASPVVTALPPEKRDVDSHLLQQYYKVKAVAMGDGKEPEKAIHLVQMSLPEDVDKALKQLKEDTLVELGLKETYSKTSTTDADGNHLSEIGTRRAHIRARTVTVDTTEEYLKKKGLVKTFSFKGKSGRMVRKRRLLKRHMQKTGKSENVESDDDDDDDVAKQPVNRVYKDIGTVLDKNVRQFMSPPSACTLSMPLKPTEKTDEAICNKEDQEDGIGSDDDVNNEVADDEPLEQDDIQTPPKIKNVISSNADQEHDEDLVSLPEVHLPPKRKRGRPRKNALQKALENSKRKISYKPVSSLCFGRGKTRPLRELLNDELYNGNSSIGIQGNPTIIDLPSDQINISLPGKYANDNDENLTGNTLRETCTMTDFDSEKDTMQSNDSLNHDNSFLTLNVQFNNVQTDIKRWMKFRIMKSVWKSIQNDDKKTKALKNKLLKLLSPGETESGEIVVAINVSPSVIEDNGQCLPRVDVKPNHTFNSFHCQDTKNLIEAEVVTSPPRRRSRGMKSHRRGKVTMVPINIGGVIRYLPSTPYLTGDADDSEEQDNESFPVDAVECTISEDTHILDKYQLADSLESSNTREESPDIKLVSPQPEDETSGNHQDFVQTSVIFEDASSSGTEAETIADMYNKESDTESQVDSHEALPNDSKDTLIINKRRLVTTKNDKCSVVAKNVNKMYIPHDENLIQSVDMDVNNFDGYIDLTGLPSTHNSVMRDNHIIEADYQRDDFSYSQPSVSTSVVFSHNGLAQESTDHALCKMQPHVVPSRPAAQTISEGMPAPLTLQCREMSVSHSAEENAKVTVDHPQSVVYSSPTSVVMPLNIPLAASSPVSLANPIQNVLAEEGHSSHILDFHGLPHSSPLQVCQSHSHSGSQTSTTSAVTVSYSNSPLKVISYQRVPVYPIDNQPFRVIEDQPTHQPELEIPTRYQETVSNTHMALERSPAMQKRSIINSMPYPHNPQHGSVTGGKDFLHTGDCKLVKVKMNGNFVYVPVNSVQMNTTTVSPCKPQFTSECENSEELQVEILDASLSLTHNDQESGLVLQGPSGGFPGEDSLVDDKNTEKLKGTILSSLNILSDCDSVSLSSSVTVPDSSIYYNIKTEDVKVFASESGAVIDQSEASPPSFLKPKRTQVCSFLFSPKYKALSALKESVGPATGTPVKAQKPRVPFFLKQSLVPKKKS
ncbi:uncharacterized protein [Cherax quadricarinatus]|nr:uncharacterized protein LOC128699457 [Cherax quadricarinatus]XP_053648193.1 uncharacterized protein LOC128699457 [Cherax quadricarinatus]XP_053648194.1 uncharacterized protein LOC128699457 [Cherax quadricarinatus]XP_053648195.1 uncharacterized protein LOC128699457 [Cherax quadricarinatus]XP_053648196.1 uncharacterized protein LOC128699457 [Cherax quadricarinatus]